MGLPYQELHSRQLLISRTCAITYFSG